jgi:hypothetical protein
VEGGGAGIAELFSTRGAPSVPRHLSLTRSILAATLSLAIRVSAQSPYRPPAISITSSAPEYRSAEARLARFAQLLQEGHRRRAAELMSSRVTPRERQGLIEKRWLRQATGRTGDFMQVLYLPDLQIRTRERMQGNAVRLEIGPRHLHRPPKGRPTGILIVRMLRERGRWMVDLHPDSGRPARR